MTKQEKLLNEFRANPPTIIKIKDDLLGLRNYGIVAVGERLGNSSIFKKIPIEKLDDRYKKVIEEFVIECKDNDLRFRNADIEIDDYQYKFISLFNNSIILEGDFNKLVHLYNHSYIVDGTFNKIVSLQDDAYIEKGIFKDEVALFGRAYIKKGIFNEVGLSGDSYIKDGIFNGKVNVARDSHIDGGVFNDKIVLYGKAKINGGKFQNNCMVELWKTWEKDEDTLNLLRQNGIKVYEK